MYRFTGLPLKGIIKAGDIIAPGDDKFPKFSSTPFVQDFKRISDFMVTQDREDLKLLMTVFALLPTPVIKLILIVATQYHHFPEPICGLLRQINMGVRGIILTMYYSGMGETGEKILMDIGYKVEINTKVTPDMEMESLLKESNPLLMQKQKTASELMQASRPAHLAISRMSVEERLKFITKLRLVILERQEEITDIIQKETHKARTDIMTSEFFPIFEHLEFLEHEARNALKDEKVATPIAMMGKASKIWYESMGTVLAISPWNYPFYQAIAPITCSFVTGNATIFKPSEITPLKGLVEMVLNAAGFKQDWVQIAYGDGKVAVDLINERPQKIFFTGSVATGKKIMAQASQFLIPVELELGGKDPMIVFEDANIDRAVKGAVWGAMTNTGQSCTSVERLYVHEQIYPQFREKLIQETKRIKVGIDADGDADMGHMISEKQVMIVAELVKDAISQGAVMLTGQDWDFKSRAIPAILLENTTHAMRINREEIFGPVLPLMSFKNEEDAIRLANDSDFGLSASVWSKDKVLAERVARALVTGNISINNVMVSEGNHALPFGGVKDSGIGRYKGVMGLRNFCNIKSVMVDADSKKIEANWYPYSKTKYSLFSGLTQSLFYGGLKKWVGLVRFGLPLEGHSQKAKRD
jgi:acyl-CoA reductase-like NAD-dependent aldehyde dehydrogenase